jgi:uncharacterized protein
VHNWDDWVGRADFSVVLPMSADTVACVSVDITVRGSFAVFERPERGIVHAVIGYESPEMDRVYQRLVHDLDAVTASITALHDPGRGPVTWWSAEQLRTWSTRPWNKDGKQLPLVHHASVAVEVKFSDFAALSRWVGEQISSIGGFRISRVEWALTVKRKDALLADVRTRAVRDAVTRAQQYADALGLGAIAPTSIADAGMLVAGAYPANASPVATLRGGYDAGLGSDVELTPKDIEVSAAVDARFVVDRS